MPRSALYVPLLAGALLLILAEFITVREIRAVTAVPPGGTSTGGDLHGYALGIIGLAMLPMTFGAVHRGARPAVIALLVLAVAACVVVLAIDLPDMNEAGLLARTYEGAQARPATGFYLESLGAALALVGAVALLTVAPAPAVSRR